MELQEFSGGGAGSYCPVTREDGLVGDYRAMSWVNNANNVYSELVSLPTLGPGLYPSLSYMDPVPNELMKVVGDTWMDVIEEKQLSGESQQELLTVVTDLEEDIGIRLVHALLMCAESIQHGKFQLANSLIVEMSNGLMTRVNTVSGIGKVAAYFIDALSRRLYQSGLGSGVNALGHLNLGFVSNDLLYHNFYETCPYLKFAHFTANQAILESFEGHTCVHVIDFSLMHGLQWPALIQALALRPSGPPTLRLTAISPTSSDGHDHFLHKIGLRLAQLAQSINVSFSFRVVTTSRLEDLKPWTLQTKPEEVIAVNSILQLHQLLGSDIGSILKAIRSLNPKIVTIVEQEANHNQPEFLVRFTEALHYYSAMFDSLEACQVESSNKTLAEAYLQREICNIVCYEGLARVERHEPLAKWRVRMSQAGFEPLNMGHKAFKQANMLLTLCSAQGYCVQEIDGCLTLGWHNRPLFVASAWQVIKIDKIGVNCMVNEGSSLSSSSSS